MEKRISTKSCGAASNVIPPELPYPSDSENRALLSFVLNTAGWLEVLTSILFSLFVVVHQRSKIYRWKTRFSWWEPFCWQECWIVVAMWLIAAVFAFYWVPELKSLLPPPAAG